MYFSFLISHFIMFLFAAGFAELVILLIIIFGSLVKGIAEYFAEQKKKQQEQELQKVTEKILPVPQENEQPVLAETLEILYDLEEMDAAPAKSKKPPKIRAKSTRKKLAEQQTEFPVTQPVLAATVELVEPAPMPTGTSRPQPSPLAVELVKMFQSPTGVQQAVLASEILKRRF